MTAVGYVGGDPDKLDRAGYTLGDVIAADATGTLVPVALGAPTEVLTVEPAEATDVGWGAAGGGATTAVRLSRITTGSVTFPNSAPAYAINAALNAPPIPAAVGDYVEVSITALFDFAANSFVDIGVVVGGVIVRYMGTGSGALPTEGNPGLYPDPGFNGYIGPQGFVVTAPDLSAGNVQFALVSLATGTGQALATADFPFAWNVKNLGPVI